ncbi:MAG: NAD(P)H-quinone oxidoreductase [Alphaproteobacteria bacterium]|nr:NAD(P)H-quinone oxidoreductase [Alphaproteobacteria bacterium]
MKAWCADGGHLKACEIATPIPAGGEVLIRVEAAGINRADLLQIEGKYPAPETIQEALKNVPGLEISGFVEAIGSGMTAWKPGDAVCALLGGGGYAEYAVAPQEQLLPVPQSYSMHEAAALPEALFTCWQTLIMEAALQPGETLLVHGGGSGIGTMAVQLGKWRGAKVYVTARQEEKCALCLKLGADGVFLEPSEDFVDGIKQATGGKGADVILDMVGGAYAGRNFKAAAPGGRIIQIALLGGAESTVPLGALLMKRLTWRGSTLRSRSVSEKKAIRDAILAELWPALDSGRICPILHEIHKFTEVEKALSAMKANLVVGKTVLTL